MLRSLREPARKATGGEQRRADPRERVHTALEVAVAAEHRGHDQVQRRDRLRHLPARPGKST